ncbi:MAG: AAA family ATPase [Candidatus Lokiarchaeota archaeon]|nr:AAA family ATPase [Candidatus Lokiarchaeota archaeon]
MEIRKIRIRNFRSIQNSSEWEFHKDHIQVLIGKNASGKTSILDALEYLNFNIHNIKEEDRPLNNLYTNTELIMELDLSENEINHSTFLDIKSKEVFRNNTLKITKVFTNYNGFNYKLNDISLHEFIEDDINEIINLLEKNGIEFDSKEQYFLQIYNYYHNLDKMKESLIKLKDYIVSSKLITLEEDFAKIINFINNIDNKISFFRNLIYDNCPFFIKFNYKLYDHFGNDLWYSKENFKANKLVQLIFNCMGLKTQDFIKNSNNSNVIHQLIEKRDLGLEKFLNTNWLRNNVVFIMNFYPNRFECSIKEQEEIKNISQLSEGELWFFIFLVYIYNKVDLKKKTIILIDEPSINLHPNAQRNILILMEKFLKNNPNLSIIYTTHSPYLVPPDHLDRILLVIKTNERGTYIKQLNYENLCELKTKRLKKKCKPENIKARLLQMLTVSIREGFFGNIVVLCEGPTEFLSIPIWASIIEKNLDEKGIVLIQTAGKYIMIDYAELFSIFDIPVFLIFDNDRYSTDRKGHKRLNKWLLKFCGADLSDYPDYSGENYFVFDPYYEKHLRKEDPKYIEIEQYIGYKYGLGKKKGLRARYVAMRYLELNIEPPTSIKKLINSIFKYQEKYLTKTF